MKCPTCGLDNSPILSGWKAIAHYIGKEKQAAQYLAREHGLPIKNIGGTVFSIKSLLEAWIIDNMAEKGGK